MLESDNMRSSGGEEVHWQLILLKRMEADSEKDNGVLGGYQPR